MNNPFDLLSDFNKGIALIIMGIILLLYTLGVVRDILWYFIIGFSIYMIFLGLIKVNAYKKAMQYIKKQEKDSSDE